MFNAVRKIVSKVTEREAQAQAGDNQFRAPARVFIYVLLSTEAVSCLANCESPPFQHGVHDIFGLKQHPVSIFIIFHILDPPSES